MTPFNRGEQTAAPNLPLTYLFVPGNRADRFDKAVASQAGAIIVDLEDAVAPNDKAAARAKFATWFRAYDSAPERILVRINHESTPWFDEDIALIAEGGVRGVVLPKAESTAQIERIGSALAANGFVVPLVETAKGILDVDSLARTARVQRIAFGTLDYALDLDLPGDDRGFAYPACRIALASRAAEIASPIAGVTIEIDRSIQAPRRSRFRACLRLRRQAVHPSEASRRHPCRNAPERSRDCMGEARCGRRRIGPRRRSTRRQDD